MWLQQKFKTRGSSKRIVPLNKTILWSSLQTPLAWSDHIADTLDCQKIWIRCVHNLSSPEHVESYLAFFLCCIECRQFIPAVIQLFKLKILLRLLYGIPTWILGFLTSIESVSLHGLLTEIKLITVYSLQPKMEKLYTVSKNKTWSWLWLWSSASHSKIQA